MTDARTIIANAMGHNLAEWRDSPDFLDDGEFESSADAALRELALAGFEVCAVAAPTTDARTCYHPDTHIHTEVSGTQSWTIIECRVCGAKRSAAYGTPLPSLEPMPVAAPTITPQPRESIEALRRDPLAARSIDAAVHDHWWNDALDAVLALLDGVGGSITPTEDTERALERVRADDALNWHGLRANPIPADQEDTDE